MIAAAPSPPFLPARLPLCAHCGLPLAGKNNTRGPLYCCTGCALVHRVTGGGEGHGRATGLLMAVGIGAFLAINVMMLSFILYSGDVGALMAPGERAAGEAWVRWALLLLATPAFVLLGGPFFLRGFSNLKAGRLDTDVLIVIGVSASYLLSARAVFTGEGHLYLDTAMGILLFVTLGRYLEAAARARATDALSSLAAQMPAEASRLVAGGEERVPIAALVPGDRVRVRPGERFPVDGRVFEGEASVSQAELTGEAQPFAVGPGAKVGAATLNLDGSLVVAVEKTGADTVLARIVRLVEEARASGYPLAPLVDRVSAVFVPLVMVLSIATFAFWSFRADFGTGLMHALAVLLIACPCAIGIASPLVATVAASRAAAAGVLVRSGALFERLARVRRIFFDKTGTLTTGEMAVVAVRAAPGGSEERVRRLAAALELGSEHPVARAIRAGVPGPLPVVSGFRALPGKGVDGRVEEGGREHQVRLGSAEFVLGKAAGALSGFTEIHLSFDGEWLGALQLTDAPRVTAASALARLAAAGRRVSVLSGDSSPAVAGFAARFPPLEAEGGLSPEDKLSRIRQSAERGEEPMMVGDGINDAPALSRAAVAVTLASGTDLAREVSEVTLLGGDLERLPWLLGLAERTLSVAKSNLFLSFTYNIVGLGLASAGLLHPIFGAVGMVGSSLLVVLRSQRLSRFPLPVSAQRGASA